MWLKKPTPVSFEYVPVPSRLTSTEMLVSAVFRSIFGSKIGIVSINRTRKSHAQVKSITANGVAGTKMKGYEGKLSDTELDDVAAFVKSLR